MAFLLGSKREETLVVLTMQTGTISQEEAAVLGLTASKEPCE